MAAPLGPTPTDLRRTLPVTPERTETSATQPALGTADVSATGAVDRSATGAVDVPSVEGSPAEVRFASGFQEEPSKGVLGGLFDAAVSKVKEIQAGLIDFFGGGDASSESSDQALRTGLARFAGAERTAAPGDLANDVQLQSQLQRFIAVGGSAEELLSLEPARREVAIDQQRGEMTQMWLDAGSDPAAMAEVQTQQERWVQEANSLVPFLKAGGTPEAFDRLIAEGGAAAVDAKTAELSGAPTTDGTVPASEDLSDVQLQGQLERYTALGGSPSELLALDPSQREAAIDRQSAELSQMWADAGTDPDAVASVTSRSEQWRAEATALTSLIKAGGTPAEFEALRAEGGVEAVENRVGELTGQGSGGSGVTPADLASDVAVQSSLERYAGLGGSPTELLAMDRSDWENAIEDKRAELTQAWRDAGSDPEATAELQVQQARWAEQATALTAFLKSGGSPEQFEELLAAGGI